MKKRLMYQIVFLYVQFIREKVRFQGLLKGKLKNQSFLQERGSFFVEKVKGANVCCTDVCCISLLSFSGLSFCLHRWDIRSLSGG